MQSKTGSLVESLVNTAIGFGINFGANLVILPWFGFEIKPMQALYMGVVFTVISVVRGYLVRRFFEVKLKKIIYGKSVV
jgi:hypothetical protein